MRAIQAHSTQVRRAAQESLYQVPELKLQPAAFDRGVEVNTIADIGSRLAAQECFVMSLQLQPRDTNAGPAHRSVASFPPQRGQLPPDVSRLAFSIIPGTPWHSKSKYLKKSQESTRAVFVEVTDHL